MYFCDKNGLVWKQEDGGFRNIGLSVKEKTITFTRVESIKVTPSPVTVPEISDAVPITIREAVSKLHISELSPLQPLKILEV